MTPTEKPCTCRASELPAGAPDPAAQCDACREASELRDAQYAAPATVPCPMCHGLGERFINRTWVTCGVCKGARRVAPNMARSA